MAQIYSQIHERLLLRPTSVIRKTDIFSPDQWNLVPDQESETPDHDFFYHNFCPDRKTKFPKIPPDRRLGWIQRFFRAPDHLPGQIPMMTEVGCIILVVDEMILCCKTFEFVFQPTRRWSSWLIYLIWDMLPPTMLQWIFSPHLIRTTTKYWPGTKSLATLTTR